MRRLLRATKRTLRRLAKPLRLRLIDWQTRQSCAELENIYDMRDYLVQLERNEKREQVRLEIRRNQIVKGLA
jgi:hypothetical protein